MLAFAQYVCKVITIEKRIWRIARGVNDTDGALI